jgi:pimeloyl-ACP methyl ester carboxylesterase
MIATLALAFAAQSYSGGTALMIHGAGGGGWEYDLWKPVFEQRGWRVVAIDLVPSEKGLAETTIDDYVKQVENWPGADKKPLVIVGASMGGPIALRAAVKLNPQAMILINPAPPKGFPRRESTEPIPDVVKWANGPVEDTRTAMPDSDERTILWAWKKWRDESGKVMTALRDGVDVQRPTCPLLVIVSQKDTDVSPDTSMRVARTYTGDVLWYEGMSHVGPLMSTRANEVATAAEDWANRRTSRWRRARP